ncbi:hypothetical protein ID866_3417 [Astraeus odoratus]|nr:hypothetical protein ID866_3417 [Astraeus odoratus]
MSAPLPPMHAALSLLGTMAGQYLAAQSQGPAAQSQAAAQQPVPSTSKPRQAPQTNTANLCNVCNAKPKYFDGKKTYPYCGRSCAAKVQNKPTPANSPPKRGRNGKAAAANMCDYCHKQPKYNDGTTTHSFCGKTCAQKAKAAGAAPATAKPAKNGCLLCGKSVKKGHFCSQACTSKAEKRAPVLLEVPHSHDTFKNVADQFKTSWRHQTACPTVRRVYKVIGDRSSINKYEAYRFGAGIYTSSTSSKSNDYSTNMKPSNLKAILLNKVVVGKGYKMTQDNSSLTGPPPGYDSVLAEVKPGGSLNYDELVCYTENAIRPSYLVMYDA